MNKESGGLDIKAAVGGLVRRLGAYIASGAHSKKPYIIGIAGKVGAGKSYFTRYLMRRIQNDFGVPVINYPFEIWLDPEQAPKRTNRYANKFFQARFIEDLTDLSAGVSFFLMYTEEGQSAKRKVTETMQEAQWDLRHRGRTYSLYRNLSATANPLYVNQQTRLLEQRVLPDCKAVYVVDGTLVLLPKEVRGFYDASVYIDAPWVMRIARMRARFCRGEHHNMRQASLEQYITYLLDEAISGADAEIEIQQEFANTAVWNDGDPKNDVGKLLQAIDSGALEIAKYL